LGKIPEEGEEVDVLRLDEGLPELTTWGLPFDCILVGVGMREVVPVGSIEVEWTEELTADDGGCAEELAGTLEVAV